MIGVKYSYVLYKTVSIMEKTTETVHFAFLVGLNNSEQIISKNAVTRTPFRISKFKINIFLGKKTEERRKK